MKKKDILFIVVILVVVGIVYTLSVTGKKPPLMPHDATHTEAKTKAECKSCHDKGKEYPMGPEHPFKEECFVCHKEGGKRAAE